MSESLHIEMFTLGEWQTNCYVLHAVAPAPGSKECWIVDAGENPGAMVEYIEGHGLSPAKIILTHAHVDHIMGLGDLQSRWPDVPILIHPAEREFLRDPQLNLSAGLGEPVIAPDATGEVHHGDVLTLGEHEFEVRHTPGHSPGGVALYCARQKVALVGDTLFAGSVGNTDFPTSDGEKMFESIKEQLMSLPDDVKVYAGHGPTTTIGRERASNPFLND